MESKTVLKRAPAPIRIWWRLSGNFPASTTSIEAERLQPVLEDIRSLSEKLSAQAIAIIPFQVLLAASFGAAESRGGVSGVVAECTVGFLGLSIAMIALALTRVHSETLEDIEESCRQTFVHEEARKVRQKGALLIKATYLLIPAAALVALAAVEAISSAA